MRFFKSKYPVNKGRSEIPWFGKPISVLLVITMICIMAGCDKNDSLSIDGSSNISQEASENESNISLEQSGNQSEFDFDNAVRNIMLFDSNISLPCTIKAFGDDFSLENADPTDGVVSERICDLMYKGEMIGYVFLKDCKKNDKFEEKEIVAMSLGDADGSYPFSEHTKAYMEKLGKYTDLIQLDFGGVSMSSDEEDVRAIFGASPNITELSNKRYWLDYKFERGDITVTIGNDKINEILISLK